MNHNQFSNERLAYEALTHLGVSHEQLDQETAHYSVITLPFDPAIGVRHIVAVVYHTLDHDHNVEMVERAATVQITVPAWSGRIRITTFSDVLTGR